MSFQVLKQAQFLSKECHLLQDVNTKPLGFKQRLQPWKLLVSFAKSLLNVTQRASTKEEGVRESLCGPSVTSRTSASASASTVPSCRSQMKRLFILAPLVHHSFDQVLFLLPSRGSSWLQRVQLQSSRDEILIVLQEWGPNKKII